VVFLTAVEEGLLPHERSRMNPDQLEEERRLMFVGITRAQNELQISTAQYRDFRGQRKMTIPSQFLMELPREEMDVCEQDPVIPAWTEPVWEPPEPEPAPRAPAIAGLGLNLMTAAELASQGQDSPPVSPEVFHHGMLVRHPKYGLGRIAALSGIGPGRKATVDFAGGAGRMKFVLDQSPLRPVRR
jgi:DNA helicase-2/ATP-dependent DNA helicase PcrA